MNNQARVCKLPCKYNFQNICSAYGDCISHEVFIEELEKIKEEIKKQYSFYTDYGVQLGCESSCEIIDKHIKELKGENNEHTRDIK